MSNGTIRGLNLYSFYAILLPGIAFTIAIFPLLPAALDVDPLLAVIPLVAIGFVVGQGIHTIAVLAQSFTPKNEVTTSHREFLNGLLTDRSLPFEHDIPNSLRTQFVHVLNESYEVSDSDDTDVLDTDFSSNSQNDVSSIYPIIRSQIHANGTGRSRVFQSTYAFCRSVMITIPLLWGVYVLYAVLDWLNLPSQVLTQVGYSSVSQTLYTPIIETVQSEPPVIVIVATLIAALGIVTFQSATKQYKRYYVEYTLADYITHHSPTRDGRNDPGPGGGSGNGTGKDSGNAGSDTDEGGSDEVGE